jgi:hypothetical protein
MTTTPDPERELPHARLRALAAAPYPDNAEIAGDGELTHGDARAAVRAIDEADALLRTFIAEHESMRAALAASEARVGELRAMLVCDACRAIREYCAECGAHSEAVENVFDTAPPEPKEPTNGK